MSILVFDGLYRIKWYAYEGAGQLCYQGNKRHVKDTEMNKKVDPEKLKEAAELLEQAILSYPRDEKIAALHESLSELIVDAKKYKIKDALERRTIPCYRPFAEGYFREYKEPDIEHAYMNFSVELRGGRSDAEKEILFSLAERLEKSHEK